MKSNIIKTMIVICVIVIGILAILLIIFNKNKNKQIYEQERPAERYTKIKQKYECNEFKYVTVTKEDLVNIYFSEFKLKFILNIEEAYNQLDEEFRRKCFGSLDEYKRYIENNFEELANAELETYQEIKEGNYTKYICIDENKNCYIFKESAIMQYTVMLNDYIIPSEKFNFTYSSSKEQVKTALNIDRFFKAINDKNYYFAYNLLSSDFRKNYFKTQEDFEKYIKDTFFERNTIKYYNFSTEGGLYTYKIVATDSENSEQRAEKKIIMKLKDATNFEMSFNVD